MTMKIEVKKHRVHWEKSKVKKVHKNPKALTRSDRERWYIKTKKCYLLGVKYHYERHDGKRLTGSVLLEAPLSLRSEDEFEIFVQNQMMLMEHKIQMKEVQRLREKVVVPVNEYVED